MSKTAQKKLAPGFSQLPVWLKVSPELTPLQKEVYAEVVGHVRNNPSGWPGVGTMARALGVSVSAVQRAIANLESLKLIRVKRSYGKVSHYFLLAHEWQARDKKWAEAHARAKRNEAQKKATARAEARARERDAASPSPWVVAHNGQTAAGVKVPTPLETLDPTSVNTPAVTPVETRGHTPVNPLIIEETKSEQTKLEDTKREETAQEAPQPSLFSSDSPTSQKRPETNRHDNDRPHDPSPSSAGPPPLRVAAQFSGAVGVHATSSDPRAKPLAEAEQVWRVEMSKHYPLIPLDKTAWSPQRGEGKNVQALLDGYEVEQVLKYLKWAIANWGMLVSRFSNAKAFTPTPTTHWAQWKARELMGEAMSVAGAISPAQQVRALKDRMTEWMRAHPGELPPEQLAAEAHRMPKLKGDKL